MVNGYIVRSHLIGHQLDNVAALAYARWLLEDKQGLGEWVWVMETAVAQGSLPR
jgi:hypothetical protein